MNEVISPAKKEPSPQINGSSRLNSYIEDGAESIHSNDISLEVSPNSSGAAKFAGFIRQERLYTRAGRESNYTEMVNACGKYMSPENLSSELSQQGDDGYDINNNSSIPHTIYTEEVSFAEPTSANKVTFTQSDEGEFSQASEVLKLLNDGSSNAKIDHPSTDWAGRSTATTEDEERFFYEHDSSQEFSEDSVESDDDVVSLTPNDDRDASTSTTRRSRINQPLEQLTRKRSTNRSRWKSAIRKTNFNSGQEHVDRS